MEEKLIVDAAGLQQVSSQLKTNSDKIYTLYTSDITSVLKSCEDELKVSGLEYDSVYEAFKKMFTSLHTQIDELVDALNNKIIPEYELSGQAISNMFNSDFASEMNEKLKIMMTD